MIALKRITPLVLSVTFYLMTVNVNGMKISNNNSNDDEKVKKYSSTLSTKELNSLLKMQESGAQHYYSLAIPANSIEALNMALEETDDQNEIRLSLINDTYTFGNYATFEEVIAARNKFIEAKIFDVIIIAQVSGN